MPDSITPSGPPVEILNTGSDSDDPGKPKPGMALCLSGGGYRG